MPYYCRWHYFQFKSQKKLKLEKGENISIYWYFLLKIKKIGLKGIIYDFL